MGRPIKRTCAGNCNEGFNWTPNGEPRRCVYCNPPLLHFAFFVAPAEGVPHEDIQPDEYRAIAAEGVSEYMTAAISYLDRAEISGN